MKTILTLLFTATLALGQSPSPVASPTPSPTPKKFGLTALDTPPPGEKIWHIQGKVLHRQPKGLLVECHSNSLGRKKPQENEVIFLTGYTAKEAYDGYEIRTKAISTGDINYNTVGGYNKIVRSFAAK